MSGSGEVRCTLARHERGDRQEAVDGVRLRWARRGRGFPGCSPEGDHMGDRLRFGIFMAPFHPAGENPTLALQRDLELIQHLDRLGYDEAWIGEHHSAGS